MDDREMPISAHLEELRSRLLWSIVAVLVAGVGCYQVIEHLMAWLLDPLRAAGSDSVKIIGTGLVEAFFTKLKVAVIAGLFVASPVVFTQIWRFVEPGLEDHEKKYVVPFVLSATVFFVGGAAFCYELVFPTAFKFFLGEYASAGIEPMLRVSEYLSFTARMLLSFGVVFELPVFTFFFARIGLVTYQQMLATWRYAIVGIFIVAAILTPGPDVASQLLMAGPLLLLYAGSIGIAFVFGRGTSADEV